MLWTQESQRIDKITEITFSMYRSMNIQPLGQAATICEGILLIMTSTLGNQHFYEIQPFSNNLRLFYKKLETICTT